LGGVPEHNERVGEQNPSQLEMTIAQWRAGERRLGSAPVDRQGVLERVTQTLVAQLRKRLGGRFSTAELVELYRGGTSWCLQLAMVSAPEHPWAWDSSIVVDAAFARYLRESVDYAGGKRS
jgi:hypothetical protein